MDCANALKCHKRGQDGVWNEKTVANRVQDAINRVAANEHQVI